MKPVDREMAERQIEDAIDRGSLSEVLDILSNICFGKAEHVKEARQDLVTARMWEKMALRIAGIDTKGL